ncbi:hypothetical protein Hanom_Chr07g00608001 [Helianthus anomalus]
MKDYFVENLTYDEVTFRRRFRMRKPLFLRIVEAVTANDVYFQQRRDTRQARSFIIAKMYCSYACSSVWDISRFT